VIGKRPAACLSAGQITSKGRRARDASRAGSGIPLAKTRYRRHLDSHRPDDQPSQCRGPARRRHRWDEVGLLAKLSGRAAVLAGPWCACTAFAHSASFNPAIAASPPGPAALDYLTEQPGPGCHGHGRPPRAAEWVHARPLRSTSRQPGHLTIFHIQTPHHPDAQDRRIRETIRAASGGTRAHGTLDAASTALRRREARDDAAGRGADPAPPCDPTRQAICRAAGTILAEPGTGHSSITWASRLRASHAQHPPGGPRGPGMLCHTRLRRLPGASGALAPSVFHIRRGGPSGHGPLRHAAAMTDLLPDRWASQDFPVLRPCRDWS
jgi:hypothetical protein